MVQNIFLLLAQALLYFGVMVALLAARHRFGLGLFVCALGAMHFLETYLASVFYIALPFGIVSPGSTVLFSGKLAMLLLLYIREDAVTVRQPIYGLLIGNFLVVGLVFILRHHQVVATGDRLPDLSFIDEMGWLMVWGTILLFIDAIAIILIYEKLGKLWRRRIFLRLCISLVAVLTFDQLCFFVALHLLSGAPVAALIGGWVAKMGAAIVFSTLVVAYLYLIGRVPLHRSARIRDVFDILTYRERYEALLETSGRDPLTGLRDRRQFESAGAAAVAAAAKGVPCSLLIADVDRFKSINDRFGHREGDAVLKRIAAALAQAVRQTDVVYRYGGEEFVVLCPGLGAADALRLGERLRIAVGTLDTGVENGAITISVGVATCPQDGRSLVELFDMADRRLYAAKNAGRDQVVGARDDAAGVASTPARPAPHSA